MSEIVFTGELNKFEGKENVNEKKLRIEAMNVCRDKDAGKTMQNCFRKFMINEAGKSKFSLKKETSKKSIASKRNKGKANKTHKQTSEQW